jgi:hypothetical protein
MESQIALAGDGRKLTCVPMPAALVHEFSGQFA